MGFYLALVAPNRSSKLLISNLPPSSTAQLRRLVSRQMFRLVGVFLWRTNLSGVCPTSWFKHRNGYEFIPVHPVDTPDTLVTRPADAPAQQEVMLSPVETCPGVCAGPVNELPILARLCALQPDRMHPGVAHQPCPPVTFQPGM